MRLYIPVGPHNSTSTPAGICQSWPPGGSLVSYHLMPLLRGWAKSQGPLATVAGPGLRKPESGQWILERFQGVWPLVTVSIKVNAGSKLPGHLLGQLPNHPGTRGSAAAAGDRCHRHLLPVTEQPPTHSFCKLWSRPCPPQPQQHRNSCA